MCTIIVFHRVLAGYPLVVAANRDEFYARRATGPEVLADPPRVIGGRDLAHGGSWLGAAATGLFVGLTNQRTWQPPDAGLHSRGAVVVEALRSGSVDGVRRYLASLDARRYNPFNLVFGDAGGVIVAYARPDAAAIEVAPAVEPITVLANDRLGSADFPKTARAVELAAAVSTGTWPELVGQLGRVLADHHRPDPALVPEPPPDSALSKPLLCALQALCIHTPAYGTRSATLIALEPRRVAHYAYADGPPCTAAFSDVTGLLTG